MFHGQIGWILDCTENNYQGKKLSEPLAETPNPSY